ncbi:hypothetical protein FPANT_9095 [Fusarium pseudoanthophilum]|uniref:Uncharacterized protein n=1 Tax=Fusarium pseudoanthophilum TaxID=48495 RepID=A0A8H5KUS8_9HYPO|nr:hypothetical protein FPANT_9095 [Fusarium pseudoanthophilum]
MGPQEFELRSVVTLTNDPDGELHRPRQSSSLAKDKQVIRYYKRSLWIFGFYLLILVLPWIFTCILMVRPINRKSYFNQSGSITPGDVNNWNRSRAALSSLTALSGVIGLPIVSGLLAHGAVVYTQRRNPGQKLSVLQLFALADREWLDPRYLFKRPSKLKSTERSLYLWLATFLILITAIQPPIQMILVRDERIAIVTCKGHPAAYNNDDSRACRFPFRDLNTQIIARDAEPIDLNFCPQDIVVKKTSQKLLSSANSDIQTNLWRTFDWYYPESSYDKGRRPYYASSVPNGTTTGVYRHHAARMDSTANCYLAKNFPKECKGDKPFAPSFSEGWLKVDICAEGSYDTVAWNTSRNKQEHNETLWLSMKWDIPEDATVSQEEGGFSSRTTQTEGILGPYVTSGLRGEKLNNICDNSLFPMLGLMPDNYNMGWCSSSVRNRKHSLEMQDVIYYYFNGLKNEEATAQALEKAMFFANEALLTTAASLPQKRPIFYSPGTAVMKPKKDLVATIIVTTLIGLQVTSLCVLMWFILRAPTWTETLDADALAQIGGQLKEWGEPRPDLRQINGIVGVDETRHQAETSSVGLPSAPSQSGPVHLTLGGEGLINRGVMKRMQADTTTVVEA